MPTATLFTITACYYTSSTTSARLTISMLVLKHIAAIGIVSVQKIFYKKD